MHWVFYLIAALTALYSVKAPSQDVAVMSLVGGGLIALAARWYQVARRNYGFGTALPRQGAQAAEAQRKAS